MNRYTVVIAVGALCLAGTAQALEVDREVLPRVTLGGRVVGTIDVADWDSDPTVKNSINDEDSSVLLRMDKRLYGNGVAGAMLGFREDADRVHFGEHYVFYWNQQFAVNLGHARLRNTLIEFPTLREDDLLSATHVGNASSTANFDQTHGDIASIETYFANGDGAFGVWGGSRVDEPGIGVAGIDTAGVSVTFNAPDALRLVRRVRRAGVLLDRQDVKIGTTTRSMNAWVLGADVNLNDNPTANWSLQTQAIAVAGVGAPDLSTVAGRARAQSRSLVAALRYTSRPALLTRSMCAVTLAYTKYDDVAQATQWSVAPNVAYRLGEGVDVLLQYRHTQYGDGLGGGVDRTAQVGLAFALDARFNDTIGERNSILNQEHGYIR